MLPSSVSSQLNRYGLLDDYLFVRNIDGVIRQRGYFVFGNTLKETFDELVETKLLNDYSRTVAVAGNLK